MRIKKPKVPILICMALGLAGLALSPLVSRASLYETAALLAQAQPPLPQSQAPPEQPQPAQLSAQQMQQLVAPIALYPDPLVAQILAASAYPTQIVEAERFLQQNPNLQDAALANAVNNQPWDPSIKALTQFPSVLADMDKNLSWTSTLGDANTNQPADLMSAIQFLRQQAQQAGNLKPTPQQTVTDQSGQVVIEPANPQVVYLPEYDPELVYGYPMGLWPGFYPWWGVTSPYISFGLGFNIGPFFGFGWGWPAWGFNWGFHGGPLFARAPYVFRSHAFYDRNAFFHGGAAYRGAAPFARGDRALRGYGAPAGGMRASEARSMPSRSMVSRAPQAMSSRAPRSSAFSGIARGGDTRTFSARGRASMGGGFRAGGGGAARGGGGGHGGGRR